MSLFGRNPELLGASNSNSVIFEPETEQTPVQEIPGETRSRTPTPEKDDKKFWTPRRIGGAVTALAVAGSGAVFALRGGESSEPSQEDATELAVGGDAVAEIDAVVVDTGEFDPYEVDGSRELTEAEVDAIIADLPFSDDVKDAIVTRPARVIAAEADNLDFSLSQGRVPFVEHDDLGMWLHYDGFLYDPANPGTRLDGDGNFYEVPQDRAWDEFNLVGTATSEEAPVSDGAESDPSAATSDAPYPAYDIDIQGVQLPEMLNDPDSGIVLADYILQTTELTIREGDPRILGHLYGQSETDPNQTQNPLLNGIEEIQAENNIQSENLRLVAIFANSDDRPQELVDAAPLGSVSLDNGDYLIAQGMEIYDISLDSPRLPLGRIWALTTVGPVGESYENGFMVSSTDIVEVETSIN